MNNYPDNDRLTRAYFDAQDWSDVVHARAYDIATDNIASAPEDFLHGFFLQGIEWRDEYDEDHAGYADFIKQIKAWGGAMYIRDFDTCKEMAVHERCQETFEAYVEHIADDLID